MTLDRDTSAHRFDVCVIGGCGHVGLPLAITFARSGLRVAVHDINDDAVERVRAGHMPFHEDGAEPLLREVIGKTLFVENDPRQISEARAVVVIIGTPVDEHLNPRFHTMRRFLLEITPHLVDGQCVILRSTVFPGTTARVNELLEGSSSCRRSSRGVTRRPSAWRRTSSAASPRRSSR